MRIDMIPTGDNPPESLNVIIEVPVGGEPVGQRLARTVAEGEEDGGAGARPHPPRIAAALLAFGKPAHVAVKALGDEVG